MSVTAANSDADDLHDDRDDDRPTTGSGETIEPACHEFSVNWIFDEHGLKPYFACDSRIKDGDGKQIEEFQDRGERWRAKLLYKKCGILPPASGETPNSTQWNLEQTREFRLRVERVEDEDPTGKQSFHALISPRWRGMRVETDDGERKRLSIPSEIEEAINVSVDGSNIHFLRYRRLLRKGAQAVGIAGRYFEDINDNLSNIQDGERYLRLDKDRSGPIHARDGPLARMGHLLEDDRSGYRKIVQNDRDNHGNKLPGFYHTATLDERRVREAFPSHQLPKENKHYYAKEAKSLDDDHPLAYPKVGASMQVSLMDEKHGATQDDIEQLIDELDQAVLSICATAGINVYSTDPFIDEPYFTPMLSESGPEPRDLPLAEIEQDQSSIVIEHVADGLSPVQWESLETLVTDGGEISPADIADEHDRHVESVRRALREMEDLVHHGYAEVSLRSDHVAKMVHEAVREARQGVRRAVETAGKAIHAAENGMDETMCSFIAWAGRHDIDLDDATDKGREARMTMRFGEHRSHKETKRAIREGFRIWKAAGFDPMRYRQAQVTFPKGSKSTAWNWLPRE